MDKHKVSHQPQKLSYLSDALVIHLADFPIYYMECISERHFVIAGGGGSANTGVHNQINIMELVPNGDSCAAELNMKYHTPKRIPEAIMNGSLMKDLPIVDTRMVTGGCHATIYHINFDTNRKEFAVKNYEILEDERVKSDLKSVKCFPGRFLTGGIDGQLQIWVVNKDNKKLDKQIKAHTRAIDEIDVDLVNRQVVTISRDEIRCAVWDLSDFKLKQEFKNDFLNKGGNTSTGSKYSYRSCKFAYDRTSDQTKKSEDSFLLVACNPVPAKKNPGKLYKWNAKNLKESPEFIAVKNGVMAMTVTQDGKYLALGTNSGSVFIFQVKKLRKIYEFNNAHTNVITSLEFLTPKPESLSLTDSTTCALLSASIDRRIVLHRPGKNFLSVSKLLKVLLMALVVYLLFVFVIKMFGQES